MPERRRNWKSQRGFHVRYFSNCDLFKRFDQLVFRVAPREGANINGLNIEGARWDARLNSIVPSRLKELHSTLPIVYIKAITQDKQDKRHVYECPVYRTR